MLMSSFEMFVCGISALHEAKEINKNIML